VSALRILHLAANRWWTGSADPILRVARGLQERGHRVLVGAIRGDRFEAKARQAGIALLPDLSLDPRRAARTFLLDLARLRRIVVAERIQIVHCHHSHDHWLGALARGDAALVRTFHNVRAVRLGWASRILRRRTDAAFAVSRPIQLRALEGGFRSDQIWLLPGVADLERFSPVLDGKAIRDELGLGTAPVVGSVGRFAPGRGHELLIDAFRILLHDLPEARLLLVGKGELWPRLRNRVDELGLGDRVRFAGYRDSDLPQVVAAIDCFALMGAGSDESCRAALEAMAAARPVVARRVGALPEVVAHGETGLLVADDRAESVARALLAILTNGENARLMGEAGRRRAEAEFSPERAVSAIEAAYRLALERRSGRRPRPS
jgi:glycosyltransferase involved in cell wall biosynthesis